MSNIGSNSNVHVNGVNENADKKPSSDWQPPAPSSISHRALRQSVGSPQCAETVSNSTSGSAVEALSPVCGQASVIQHASAYTTSAENSAQKKHTSLNTNGNNNSTKFEMSCGGKCTSSWCLSRCSVENSNSDATGSMSGNIFTEFEGGSLA